MKELKFTSHYCPKAGKDAGKDLTKEGSCLIYDDAEIAKFEVAGMKQGHGKLLNGYIKIKANDANRKTLEEVDPVKSILKAAKEKAKSSPEFTSELKRLLEKK